MMIKTAYAFSPEFMYVPFVRKLLRFDTELVSWGEIAN